MRDVGKVRGGLGEAQSDGRFVILGVDTKRVFSETLHDMMVDMGFSVGRYGREACEATVRRCVEEAYAPSLDELMELAAHGDARRAETMADLRASLYGIPRTKP